MNRRSFFGLIAAAITGRKQSLYVFNGGILTGILTAKKNIARAIPSSGIAIYREHFRAGLPNYPTSTPEEIAAAYRRVNELREEWSAARSVTCILPDGSRKTFEINTARESGSSCP